MIGTNPMREALRNKLLRRADWRFLLPNPRPAKTICFASGLLAKAVALISERTIDGQFDHSTHCDLAVAVDPDSAILRKAWEALSPGASLYTEWCSLLTDGPAHLRQQLEEAGFDQVTCYWPWPWPSLSPPRFWLPLDTPTAVRYFKMNRLRVRAIVGRIAYLLRQMPWLICLRLGLTFPVCVTARKSESPLSCLPRITAGNQSSLTGSKAEGNSTTDLLELICTKWSSWGLGPPPNDLSWLLLTGGPRSISKVVGLVFADKEVRPRLAVKWSRVLETVPALAREAATLQAVQSLHPGGMQGIPRVLFCNESAGLITLGETALTGQPLWTLLRRDNYRDIAMKATTWMVQLLGKPEPCPRENWWKRLVEPVFEDFCESFGSILDPGMVRETEVILETLNALPVICEHRDFSPWNVLIAPTGDLVVLDWESAELQGLPAMDLIYFQTYLAFYLSGAMRTHRFRKSYRATLDPSTLTGGVVRECMELYLNHAGVNNTAVRPLRLLTWMLHSRSEYSHFVADVVGKPGRETLRGSLFVGLWEEELRNAAGLAATHKKQWA